MSVWRLILGFIVSAIIGTIVLWILVDKIMWPYLGKRQNSARKPPGVLTLPLGFLERFGYTGALLLGVPEWIAVWLGLKVAVHWELWKGAERGSYNIFLMGSLLSLFFGLLGAWIAIGKNPL